MAVKAVVFDFGYTLVNEDRVWTEIAGQYGWPASVFFAALGAVIERRGLPSGGVRRSWRVP